MRPGDASRRSYIGENVVDLTILRSWSCTLPASELFFFLR